MHVFEDEHGWRAVRRGEIVDRQARDLVRRRVARDRLFERPGHRSDQVAEGTERTLDREVVADTDEDGGLRPECGDERFDERALADARLAADRDHAAATD